jgi:hypothetical protein
MNELRPLSFGEILDGAISMFRRHFGLFFQLSAILMTLPVALAVYVAARLFLTFAENPIAGIVTLLPVLLVLLFASLLLEAATVRAISDSYLGEPLSFRRSLAFGLAKLWPLVLVGLSKALILALVAAGVAAVVTVAGIVLQRAGAGAIGVLAVVALGVAGVGLWVWAWAGYAVTTQVIVLQPLETSLDALGHSWRLTRGNRSKVFGLQFLAYLLFSLLPSWIFQALGLVLIARSPGIGVAALVLQVLVPVLFAPAIACVLTLTYYDLRVRREGFDLQLLQQQLGVA